MKKTIIFIFCFLSALPLFSIDFSNPRFGIRGGVGVDVTFVPAFGGELGLAFDFEDDTWLEISIGYFRSYDKWEGESYTEETTTNIFLLRGNRLFNYNPGEPGFFYFFGTGAGAVNVYWKETSPIYTSYLDEAEGTGGGLIFSLGGGQSFSGGFELRLDLPILIVFGGYYGTIIAPMLGLTAGMRF